MKTICIITEIITHPMCDACNREGAVCGSCNPGEWYEKTVRAIERDENVAQEKLKKLLKMGGRFGITVYKVGNDPGTEEFFKEDK